MCLPVVPLADGRRHVNHSFDELGFLDFWHRLITSHELVTRQTVAVFQGWNPAVADATFDGRPATSAVGMRSTWTSCLLLADRAGANFKSILPALAAWGKRFHGLQTSRSRRFI